MSDQKKRFEHSEITQTIKEKIPLDEFQKGDFSHLPDALEIYQQTITELSKSFSQELTGEDDVSIYTKKEQERMKEEQKRKETDQKIRKKTNHNNYSIRKSFIRKYILNKFYQNFERK